MKTITKTKTGCANCDHFKSIHDGERCWGGPQICGCTRYENPDLCEHPADYERLDDKPQGRRSTCLKCGKVTDLNFSKPAKEGDRG